VTITDFEDIFDRYFDDIRSFVYCRCSDEELASDIAQEVFMKLWEKRERLRREKIKTLLYKMAKEQVIDDYRKSIVRLDFIRRIQLDNYDLSPQENMQFEELKQRYLEALNLLPELQRTTFLMNRNDNLKYHEIAKQLDISVKAVEKRISAALQFLKTQLL